MSRHENDLFSISKISVSKLADSRPGSRCVHAATLARLFHRLQIPRQLELSEEPRPVRRRRLMLAVLHGGVNRAILSYALTGGRTFLGNFEQGPACINVIDVGDDWIVRAVNVTPYDLVHLRGRATTMEELWTEFKSM